MAVCQNMAIKIYMTLRVMAMLYKTQCTVA
jgi:hypothetical protein